MDNKYVAFIPARGGSKSIPLKNIKKINGQPLLYWTLDAVRGCTVFERICISTDSAEIKQTVIEYKNTVQDDRIECIDRSPETATDFATTESAMIEFAERYDFENIVLLQATSPLIQEDEITGAISLFESGNYDSVLSVVRQKRFVWKNVEGKGTPVNYDYNTRPRRQEFNGFLVENGALYITSREGLLNSRCRISGRIGLYEMDETSYFEVDEPGDWVIIEELLKQKKRKNNNIVKLFVMDCDGVLTDGGMYYGVEGDEMKKFNTKDGMGIALLKEKGIKTAIITGENTSIVKKRAEKIGIDYVFLGVKNKYQILERFAANEKIELSHIAYVGDDINDLECLKNVGVSIAVADAVDEVRRTVKKVTNKKGGEGAVREAVEYILCDYNVRY